MRRGDHMNIDNYISVRIEQLIDDKNKAKDAFDKMWYNRLIQELRWLQQVMAGKEK